MPKRSAPQAPGLKLRNGRWYARTTVRVGDASERVRQTTGFKEHDRAKAEAWLRRRISEIENALLYGPAPEAETAPRAPGFATAAADYAEKGGKRGPLGKQDVAKLTALGEFFGEKPCDEIDEEDWGEFVDARLTDGKPDTLRRWFAMFRPPMKRAGKKHGFALPDFELPAAGDGVAIFLEEDAAERLLAAYAPHARPIATMLALQGCRISEALRLTLPKDTNLKRETLTFRVTKNGEERTVPMHDRVARELRDYLGERSFGPLFLTPGGVAYNDRRAASHGAGLDGGGIRTAHRSARERAGVTGFRIHDWRHHWASWFIMKGGQQSALMELGGWRDARMVRRYVKLSVEHLRKAVNQL